MSEQSKQTLHVMTSYLGDIGMSLGSAAKIFREHGDIKVADQLDTLRGDVERLHSEVRAKLGG